MATEGSRSPTSDVIMRKENTWNVSVATEHPDMTEEANLKTTYGPGKKGGNFALPLGAKISIPDGVFSKKDSITCQVAPPSGRWRHLPELPHSEHMASEIFILSSSVHPLKKSVIVQLPYYHVDLEHNELNVKGRWKDEAEWVDIGFLKKEDSSMPSVELEIARLGVFVVTFTPKREMFPVSPQGCLYNARLNRHISVRFPKKSIDTNMHCSIQITPIPADKLAFSKSNFPVDCGELLRATEFVDITTTIPCNFRRPVTVKLPLPAGVEVENDNGSDIAVVVKTDEGWSVVDSNYKFSRTTVTCDVKTLSRFCVCQSKPDRKQKMKDAIPILDGRSNKEKGEVTMFLSLKEKSWMGVIECFPEFKTDVRTNARSSVGFQHIVKQDAPKETEQRFTSRRRPPPPKQYKEKEIDGFEIYDGCKWEIEVSGDIKVSGESDYFDNNQLQFFRNLPESYRRFVLEPRTNEERALQGVINLVPVGVEEQKTRERLSFTFKFEVDEEKVKAYFKPDEPEPEPEPEKPTVTFDLPLEPIKEERPPPPVKVRTFSASALERLTRPIRPNKIPEKESRVLTGRSLMNIARVVPEGLTLAVHLDLPDSTITGLGFDAISNGLGMADVTYKILLYWKRRLKDKRNGAVAELTEALRDMGRSEVADTVQEMHDLNKEIGPDCFHLIMQ
ncbi:uncharacterized protein [Haliotis asinina]|uniref:uncharacterized protein n=1 Tax=Haliotis asinina TaxID=109174 RepID=UPI003531F0E2